MLSRESWYALYEIEIACKLDSDRKGIESKCQRETKVQHETLFGYTVCDVTQLGPSYAFGCGSASGIVSRFCCVCIRNWFAVSRHSFFTWCFTSEEFDGVNGICRA